MAGTLHLDLGSFAGFGLRGEAQCRAYVRRGNGLGAFPGEDARFQIAAVQAAPDLGLVIVSVRHKDVKTARQRAAT
jgi:hypothetical protein